MNKGGRIPRATITRLSLYCRQLELLEFDGYRMVSSEKLAWMCQVNPAQVRKDLGYFGEFGVRGVGYDVRDLKLQIKKILAINREWKTFLYENLYRHYRVVRMSTKAERFLTDLFHQYTREPQQLPPLTRQKIEAVGLFRGVTDYIAGMTDRYALQEWERLFSPFVRP